VFSWFVVELFAERSPLACCYGAGRGCLFLRLAITDLREQAFKSPSRIITRRSNTALYCQGGVVPKFDGWRAQTPITDLTLRFETLPRNDSISGIRTLGEISNQPRPSDDRPVCGITSNPRPEEDWLNSVEFVEKRGRCAE